MTSSIHFAPVGGRPSFALGIGAAPTLQPHRAGCRPSNCLLYVLFKDVHHVHLHTDKNTPWYCEKLWIDAYFKSLFITMISGQGMCLKSSSIWKFWMYTRSSFSIWWKEKQFIFHTLVSFSRLRISKIYKTIFPPSASSVDILEQIKI